MIDNNLKLHSDADDEDIVRGLRQIYAAPREDGYWRSLEARILSRIASGPTQSIAWWDELDHWMRPALVAAAVVFLASGVAVARAHAVESDVTYEALLTPSPLPPETAIRPVLQEGRETTFRYLMTSSR